MKGVYFILFLITAYGCSDDPHVLEKSINAPERGTKKDIHQKIELYNADSTISISVVSIIDTNVVDDTHLILKNDLISTQEVFIKKNGVSKRIVLPKIDKTIDTVKMIGERKYEFFSSVIQNIYVDEYKGGKSILSLKYSGFNNASQENYYFFDTDGAYLGSMECLKNTCDTLGCDFLKKSKEPITRFSKSIFD